MNTYSKYCPNVFLAKTKDNFKRGDKIILTTRHGKENEHIIFNLVRKDSECNYYSTVRADGLDKNKINDKKLEKTKIALTNAIERLKNAPSLSDNEKDFLSLAEPIKIGHHSEHKHRRLLKRLDGILKKQYEISCKIDGLKETIEYLSNKEKEINLSMPESLEYFLEELEEAKYEHKFLKDNPEKREHSFSLAYANKKVKEIEKKCKIANILWGDNSNE
jgi:hypothetical protein